MIIGLSGKLQSGKDFAGKIMYRFLRSRFLPVTEFSAFEQSIYNDLHKKSMPIHEMGSIEVARFADPVKDIVCILIGCTRDDLENPEFKDKPLGIKWATTDVFTEKIDGQYVNVLRYDNTTPRRMMQKIGTDAMRKHLHINTWVNVLLEKYEKAKAEGVWMIVPDVRFPNEYDAIHKEGGLLVRVTKEGHNSNDTHPSETSLDDHTFDYDIIWKEPEDLFYQVKQVLIQENLIG